MIVVTVKYVVVHHARRQQGRGRHPRADGAGARAASTDPRARAGADAAGALRRGAVLRRRHRSRRRSRCCRRSRASRSRRRRSSRIVMPITLRRARRAVRRPEARHRQRRRAVRPDHVRVVRRRSRVLGVVEHRARPQVLRRAQSRATRSASSPTHGALGFFSLGAVVLAVTGAEALYADMGHFGARADPARVARAACCRRWCSTTSARARCCSPIRRRSRIRSTCWRRRGRCIPLVVLATVATVIASQAVISGAFSLTQQAMQLGYVPRMKIAAHLAATRSARSTCPASTGCCSSASSRWCWASARRRTSPPRTASR